MGLRDLLGIKSYRPGAVSAPQQARGAMGATGTAVEQKSFALGLNDALASILAISEPGVAHTAHQAMRMYRRTSAVSIPINMIAEPFSELHPILENMETGDQERSGPILDLLRRPHQSFSRQLFLEAIGKYYLIAGEVPIIALGQPGRPPVSLVPLNPATMDVTEDHETGMPDFYRMEGATLGGIYKPESRGGLTRFMNSNLRELKVIRNFSSRDNSILRGQSPLVSASRDVRQQIQGDDYNISLLEKGGRTTLMFQFTNSLDPETFEDRKREILSQFTGPQQAGKPIITHGGGLEVKDASGSPRDMEFKDLRKSTADRIWATYKVPLVLNSTDAATFSNMDAAVLMLWNDAILPLANRIFGELGEWLLPAFDMDPAIWRITGDFDKVDSLRDHRTAELQARVTLGLETINELRSGMPGRDDVEGGEELLVSGAMTPLSQLVVELDLDESLLGDVPGKPGETFHLDDEGNPKDEDDDPNDKKPKPGDKKPKDDDDEE